MSAPDPSSTASTGDAALDAAIAAATGQPITTSSTEHPGIQPIQAPFSLAGGFPASAAGLDASSIPNPFLDQAQQQAGDGAPPLASSMPADISAPSAAVGAEPGTTLGDAISAIPNPFLEGTGLTDSGPSLVGEPSAVPGASADDAFPSLSFEDLTKPGSVDALGLASDAATAAAAADVAASAPGPMDLDEAASALAQSEPAVTTTAADLAPTASAAGTSDAKPSNGDVEMSEVSKAPVTTAEPASTSQPSDGAATNGKAPEPIAKEPTPSSAPAAQPADAIAKPTEEASAATMPSDPASTGAPAPTTSERASASSVTPAPPATDGEAAGQGGETAGDIAKRAAEQARAAQAERQRLEEEGKARQREKEEAEKAEAERKRKQQEEAEAEERRKREAAEAERKAKEEAEAAAAAAAQAKAEAEAKEREEAERKERERKEAEAKAEEERLATEREAKEQAEREAAEAAKREAEAKERAEAEAKRQQKARAEQEAKEKADKEAAAAREAAAAASKAKAEADAASAKAPSTSDAKSADPDSERKRKRSDSPEEGEIVDAATEERKRTRLAGRASKEPDVARVERAKSSAAPEPKTQQPTQRIAEAETSANAQEVEARQRQAEQERKEREAEEERSRQALAAEHEKERAASAAAAAEKERVEREKRERERRERERLQQREREKEKEKQRERERERERERLRAREMEEQMLQAARMAEVERERAILRENEETRLMWLSLPTNDHPTYYSDTDDSSTSSLEELESHPKPMTAKGLQRHISASDSSAVFAAALAEGRSLMDVDLPTSSLRDGDVSSDEDEAEARAIIKAELYERRKHRTGNRGNKLKRKDGSRWVRRGKLGAFTEARAEKEIHDRVRTRIAALQRAGVQALLNNVGEPHLTAPAALKSWPAEPEEAFQPKSHPLTSTALAPSLLRPILSARQLLESQTLKHTFRNPHIAALSRTALDLRESEGVLSRSLGRCFAAMERIDMDVLARDRPGQNQDGSRDGPAPGANGFIERLNGIAADEASGAPTSAEARYVELVNERLRTINRSREVDPESVGAEGTNATSNELNPAFARLDELFVTPGGLPIPLGSDPNQHEANGQGSGGGGLDDRNGSPAIQAQAILTVGQQRDVVRAALDCLHELSADSREYVERLDEVRSRFAAVKRRRAQVWEALRLWALKREEEEEDGRRLANGQQGKGTGAGQSGGNALIAAGNAQAEGFEDQNALLGSPVTTGKKAKRKTAKT